MTRYVAAFGATYTDLAIILERAYIQWSKLDWLGVRVGQFLTPYGIWNVDHGTPTLITMFRPRRW